MMPTDSLNELRIALAEGGVSAAIAILNSRTACRFTSMYRFDRDMLRTLTFYDREDPTAYPPDDIPVEVSYCVYVRDSGQPFHVENSLSDMRLELHSKRSEIQSYGACRWKMTPAYRSGHSAISIFTRCRFRKKPSGSWKTSRNSSKSIPREKSEAIRQMNRASRPFRRDARNRGGRNGTDDFLLPKQAATLRRP